MKTHHEEIKVLHIIGSMGMGGAEMALSRLIEGHSDYHENIKHVVVTLSKEVGVLGERLRENGVEVYAMDARSYFSLPLVTIKLALLIRKIKPDFAQTWMYHANLFGGLVAKLCGVKIVWGIRTTDPTQGASRLIPILNRIGAKLSKWIPAKTVFVSNSSQKYHLNIGYEKSNAVVIPNGFKAPRNKYSADEINQYKDTIKVCRDNIIIGSIARYSPVKNHRLFIRAASLVLAKCPKISFVMAGDGLDTNNSDLMRRLDEAGIIDNVVLLGRVEDVEQLLAAVDIFCLHSKTEGFPNALAEAMASAVPSVCTNVGECGEILNRDSGLSEIEDEVGLSNNLIDLVLMPRFERESIGQAGRARVLEIYSDKKVLLSYYQLYSSLINPTESDCEQ
jgi:glycosyltransferase involved in cell wall biosynthesis